MLHEKKVWPAQCPYDVVDVSLKTWKEIPPERMKAVDILEYKFHHSLV